MLTIVLMKLAIFYAYFLLVVGAFAVMINAVVQSIGQAYDDMDRFALFLLAFR
jgi:choline-glycine betaine transporter